VSERVLCDTNVLVSALIAGGPPSRVIEAAIDGRIELVLTTPVLEELERVLAAKFGFTPDHLAELHTFLTGLAHDVVPAPTGTPNAVSGDPADDAILACAVAANVSTIVSGDRKHMLTLGTHQENRIVTPQALLAELAGGPPG
jgi:putative PIN family toxin of toxin-antitoxin system